MSEEKKVWITKYALTSGAFEIEATVEESGGVFFRRPNDSCLNYAPHDHAHLSKEFADRKVLLMIAAKRKAIAKELAKLNALEAEINGGINEKAI
jgi:hypothetical protein